MIELWKWKNLVYCDLNLHSVQNTYLAWGKCSFCQKLSSSHLGHESQNVFGLLMTHFVVLHLKCSFLFCCVPGEVVIKQTHAMKLKKLTAKVWHWCFFVIENPKKIHNYTKKLKYTPANIGWMLHSKLYYSHKLCLPLKHFLHNSDWTFDCLVVGLVTTAHLLCLIHCF